MWSHNIVSPLSEIELNNRKLRSPKPEEEPYSILYSELTFIRHVISKFNLLEHLKCVSKRFTQRCLARLAKMLSFFLGGGG